MAGVQDWLVGTALHSAHNALGLLATQLIGLRDHTGTRYKAVKAGAAAAAVRSVLLARAGISSGRRAVDVVFGLLGVGETAISQLCRDGLPAPVPVAPKAFPTCGASHTAIEATLTLRQQWPDPADPTVTIEVTCRPLGYPGRQRLWQTFATGTSLHALASC
jgi:2-methylcitrate dehydratase PrpD